MSGPATMIRIVDPGRAGRSLLPIHPAASGDRHALDVYARCPGLHGRDPHGLLKRRSLRVGTRFAAEIAPVPSRTSPVCLRTAPVHSRTAPVHSRTAPVRSRTAPVRSRTAPVGLCPLRRGAVGRPPAADGARATPRGSQVAPRSGAPRGSRDAPPLRRSLRIPRRAAVLEVARTAARRSQGPSRPLRPGSDGGSPGRTRTAPGARGRLRVPRRAEHPGARCGLSLRYAAPWRPGSPARRPLTTCPGPRRGSTRSKGC